LSDKAVAVICRLGTFGYKAAIDFVATKLEAARVRADLESNDFWQLSLEKLDGHASPKLFGQRSSTIGI